MAHSFHCLTYHFIWSTKSRAPVLSEDIQPRLWEYLAGICHQKKINPLCIGGWFDHIHALVRLPPHMDVSKAVQILKGPSSKWLHETFSRELAGFEWQAGYAAFTVSQSLVPEVFRYIKDQKEHHRLRTFQEEFLSFLEKHDIAWNPAYVWG